MLPIRFARSRHLRPAGTVAGGTARGPLKLLLLSQLGDVATLPKLAAPARSPTLLLISLGFLATGLFCRSAVLPPAPASMPPREFSMRLAGRTDRHRSIRNGSGRGHA